MLQVLCERLKVASSSEWCGIWILRATITLLPMLTWGWQRGQRSDQQHHKTLYEVWHTALKGVGDAREQSVSKIIKRASSGDSRRPLGCSADTNASIKCPIVGILRVLTLYDPVSRVCGDRWHGTLLTTVRFPVRLPSAIPLSEANTAIALTPELLEKCGRRNRPWCFYEKSEKGSLRNIRDHLHLRV